MVLQYANLKNNQPGGAGVCCWCHGHILHAVALHFVLWWCFLCCGSCRGKPLHAVAKLFVLWQSFVLQQTSLCCSGIALHHSSCCSLCCGEKRCAAALHGVPCCHFFMPHKKRPAAAFHGMLRSAGPLFFVPLSSLLCHGIFLMPQQEMMCRSILCHCSTGRNNILLRSMALHIMVCCAAVPCIFCDGATARMGDNQPVWHWLPRWHSGGHFGLVGFFVCGGYYFVVFLGWKKSTCAVASVVIVVGWFFGFCIFCWWPCA